LGYARPSTDDGGRSLGDGTSVVSSVLAGALDPQGPVADSMATLWWVMLALGLVVFVVVIVVLVLGLFRRRNPPDPRSDGPASPRLGRMIVVGGVVMPVVVVSAVFAATVVAMRDVARDPPPDALIVEVVGHQWWWEVRYPAEGIVTANEIHIPVDRPVAFRLASADVIHSFWAPALGGKMDLLPDGVNTLVLEADVPGVHRTECAEFCGLHHALMELTVVAEPADQFAAWVAGQSAPAVAPTSGVTQRGEQLFVEGECAQCHTIRGTTAEGADGPDLTHLASRSVIGAGAAENTSDDLREWITDPHRLKNDVAMPATELSDADVQAIVAYLESLE
jgi:cytochrome c oxidase subunit II